MAVRSGARKATRRRKATRLERLERQLPPTLREFAGELRKRLDRLERDATKAQVEVRRRAAKLLREASVQLGRLEKAVTPAKRKRRPAARKKAVVASEPAAVG